MPPLAAHNHLQRFSVVCKAFLTCLIFICITENLSGQADLQAKLERQVTQSHSDSEKIFTLGTLSDFFYASKDFKKGDSVIEKQIMLADALMSERLSVFSYFNNAGYRSAGATATDRSPNARNYVMRALAFAKDSHLPDYTAMAYASLSMVNIFEGNVEEGLKNANLAFTSSLNSGNDSAKIICALQLGNVYLQRSDILMAFKTYINAQNIAVAADRESLLPSVYHAIAGLYKKLGNEETARKYVHRSLFINRKFKNRRAAIDDNIFLAKMSNYVAGKEYLQQAVLLADSVNNYAAKIEAEKILFFHMLFHETPAYMLSYLEKNSELKAVFIHSGPNYLEWMIGEIYLYGGQGDSAITHFKKAEPDFRTGYDINVRKNFFGEYAYCYNVIGDKTKAQEYYLQAFQYATEAGDLSAQKNFSLEIRKLYENAGDYFSAYRYSMLYEKFKDSADVLSRERDLALLEIDNVAQQQVREEEFAKEQQRRKYNLQYMMITIVVATVFLLLIMIGMFKVSAFTIRLMGFLSLIFLFEFLILLLDNWIHALTHGEPWKVWVIKIGIISVLLPLHHFLEHKLIHYLLSRHLIFVRNKVSSFTLSWRKKKKVVPSTKQEETLINEPPTKINV